MQPPSAWLTRLESIGRDLAHGLLQLLYPAACAVCGRPLEPDQVGFCPACRAALTADPHERCPRCAATAGPFAALDGGCTHCRDLPFHFERVVRLGPYHGLLRDVVLRMKHGSGEGLAEEVGVLWAGHAAAGLRELGADLVVPVPLHWRRRWQRGYNQSEALARGLAGRLGLPCRTGLLRRVRHTPQQTQQIPSARHDNVRHAFARAARLTGQSVLLVDDVLTTGATASEAAGALRRAGAGRVVVAVLARSSAR